MSNRNSYFINSLANDEKAIQLGIAWIDNLDHNTGLLAVPGQDNLTGTISQVLGNTFVSKLKKGNSITISNNTKLSLLKKISEFNGPIIVIYPTPKLLDKIDDMYNVTDVLVIPWLFEEIIPWIKGWGAKELGSSLGKNIPKLSLEYRIIDKLEKLSKSVNLSTGIGHPSDKNTAIRCFEYFKSNNISVDLIELRAWLIANNWKSKSADLVIKLATKYL